MPFLFNCEHQPTHLYLKEAMEFGVKFYFTTRFQGVSPEPFSSLNLSYTTSDKADNVLINRCVFFNAASLNIGSEVFMQQTHGKNIHQVKGEDQGRGWLDYTSAIPDTDGLITDCEGITLCAAFADCVPLWLFDPVKKVGGIIHAGWKGTASSIAKEGVRRLQQIFNVVPRNLLCGVGPSIGPCCFKVDPSTANAILQTLASHLQQRVIYKTDSTGDLYLDLGQINGLQLEEIGVLKQNIHQANMCTCCMDSHFFSYRRDKEAAGRMLGIFNLGGESCGQDFIS